jgi:uncharacterized protein DUF3293
MAGAATEPVPPALLAAYRRSTYTAGNAAIRIGRRSAAMDALLCHHHAMAGVFITAWNPYSRRMPRGWNDRLQRALRGRLRRWPVFPACGGAPGWEEAHFLVLAPPGRVFRLARLFRQNAVVVVRRRRAAGLAWVTGRRAASAPPASDGRMRSYI